MVHYPYNTSIRGSYDKKKDITLGKSLKNNEQLNSIKPLFVSVPWKIVFSNDFIWWELVRSIFAQYNNEKFILIRCWNVKNKRYNALIYIFNDLSNENNIHFVSILFTIFARTYFDTITIDSLKLCGFT